MRRGDKEFQELVDEMVADILQRDMDSAGQKARRKAEHEHKASVEKEYLLSIGLRTGAAVLLVLQIEEYETCSSLRTSHKTPSIKMGNVTNE